MSKIAIDRVGQKVVEGDWCAITQHNKIYVGKVIKAGASVNIALDSIDEFIITDKVFNSIVRGVDKILYLKNKFLNYSGMFHPATSFARNGKFIKIKPTNEMLINYDK